MVSVRELRSLMRQDTWRYSLIAGLALAPLTAVSYSQSANHLDLAIAVLAGVTAGYLYDGRGSETRSVGRRAGLIAVLPGAGMIVYEMSTALDGLGGPVWFQGAALTAFVSFLVVVFALVVGLSLILGTLGSVIGRWIAGKTRGSRPSSA